MLLDAAIKKTAARVARRSGRAADVSTRPSRKPGTVAAAGTQACNARCKRLVAGRPHSNFIDYRVDNALTRDRANFADFIHYRAIIARRMEQGIADSIRLGEAAKIEF